MTILVCSTYRYTGMNRANITPVGHSAECRPAGKAKDLDSKVQTLIFSTLCSLNLAR